MEDDLKQVFTQIKQDNHWGDADSVSGTGSNLIQTETIRKALPVLFKDLKIRHLVDAPCGDLHWMRALLPELKNMAIKYEGLDIVDAVISKNKLKFPDKLMSFSVADITSTKLPTADLILTRDCLVHLSFRNIQKIIKNYKNSGSKYLLTTTFTNCENNIDIQDGGWRPLNLQAAPFYFPKPLLIINENCTENGGIYADKSLALWEIGNIKNIKTVSLFIKKLK